MMMLMALLLTLRTVLLRSTWFLAIPPCCRILPYHCRGQCAQACRMPYGLLVGGELKEMGDFKYQLSPQDLMAVEQVRGRLRIERGRHVWRGM